MNTTEILERLASVGVELWVEQGRLRYRAPQGALSPEMRAWLIERKQEILALLGGEAASQAPAEFPLCHGQRALWFLHQSAPSSAAYNVAFSARIRSPLDVAALEQAAQALIERHPSLRCVYEERPGFGARGSLQSPAGPVQRVQKDVKVFFEVEDASALAGDALDARLLALFERPFDLERGPILRVHLLRRSAQDHVLLLLVHHIAVDFWSFLVVLDELFVLYAARVAGRSAGLPPPGLPYAEFVRRQAEMIDSEEGERHFAYWQGVLGGASPALELPVDHPRPRTPSYRGDVCTFALGAELTRKLKALAIEQGATLNTTLLGAFQVLLHRYSGQDEVRIGMLTSGRNAPDLAGTVGYCVNPVVLGTSFDDDPRFLDVVERVRTTALSAYEHQEYPFALLVERLQPVRDPSRSPWFQALFVVQQPHRVPGALPFVLGVGGATMELGGLALESIDLRQGISRFDLDLMMVDGSEGLTGFLIFNTEILEASTARRMMDHFRVLLDEIVADPERHVSELPLLSPGERNALGRAHVGPCRQDFPRSTLRDLFEAQVRRTPASIAAFFGAESRTYSELNRRANQIAHVLRSSGIGPGSLVGICVERSIGMLEALLGVLKAGGAYVPLDPGFPEERLSFMLRDASVAALLTEEAQCDRHASAFGALAGAPVLRLDTDRERFARQPEHDPHPTTAPEELAYVLYTSGSTGLPKGVQIEHRALANFLLSMQEAPGIGAEDVLLAVTTLSFDIAGLELWLPLITGARVDIAPREMVSDGARLAARITEIGATRMQATPTTFRLLLASGWGGDPRLTILCGGEALPRDLANQLAERSAALWNMYGPTETTIWSALTNVGMGQGSVYLGRPIANTQLYVLDGRGDPSPPGVPGELYIGGAGVARGYLRRPALTAERFVPDPFGSEPGARMYRTGDLVRARPEGDIEFLGRVDHQMKIRGFRVELGEIEAALRRHPAVRDAVVVASTTGQGDARLLAYAAVDSGSLGSGEAARWRAEQVEQWREIWDQNYQSSGEAGPRERDAEPDPVFDISGWNSSYTEQPIPAEQMLEWVETTVADLLALRPRRVLEIGCGSGLLLFRIAPRCEAYVATDFSHKAISLLERQLSAHPLPSVSLLHRSAEDFSGIEPRSFDVVVLNSVVQYLPSADDLRRILAGAVEAVRPGGVVFVGDVRSLPLLETFHAGVELHRALPSMSKAELGRRVQRALAQEEELVLAPDFFLSLPADLPRIGRVELQPRRGRHHNELTRFRYQALLRVDPPAREAVAIEWIDGTEGIGLDAIRRWIEAEGPASAKRPEAWGIFGLPNARLAGDVEALRWLSSTGSSPGSAGAFSSSLPQERVGLDPANLWALGESLGMAVGISWARHGADGRFDVVFQRGAEEPLFGSPGPGAEPACSAERRTSGMSAEGAERARGPLANDPLLGRLRRKLAPELRGFLKERLPEYMVPSVVTILGALPLTPNGKVDRRALPEPEVHRPELEVAYEAPHTDAEKVIATIWRELLQLEKVGLNDNFFDLGGHSILLVQLRSRLAAALHRELSIPELFQRPTIRALARHLEQSAAPSPATNPMQAGRRRSAARRLAARRDPAEGIAIVGMAGRFPGARTLEAFWQNLRDGVESITFFTPEELEAAGVDPRIARSPSYIGAASVLDDIDRFDASFFGYSPREASLIDPQHRLFLECAFHALEAAGYDSMKFPGAIGVYAGLAANSYLAFAHMLGNLTEGVLSRFIASSADFLSTRTSYKLNLRGPSITLQTACSTSLVAVHLACQSLLAGECDAALAGGVSVKVSEAPGYFYQEGGIASPDGHCRAFDARGQGTLFGNGVGVVVLKRLADALADGDTVRAVIKGTAVNNDGSAKMGFTAPSVESQAQVIADALDSAGIDAATIGYVETHGTATPLGDPIEIAALQQAFGPPAGPGARCALGSVKTNIGHLDAAAGVASLLKTVLMLEHRKLVPSLHFEVPNPEIDFEASRFFVNTALSDWRSEGGPRRAGVSSFGFGGTNAHVVLEEAPAVAPRAEGSEGVERPLHVLPLSAREPASLATLVERYAAHLDANPAQRVEDICFTAGVGRAHGRSRVAIVAGSREGLRDKLTELLARRPGPVGEEHEEGGPKVAFLFTGQGSHYSGMGRQLYETQPAFRATLERCEALLRPHLPRPLLSVLFPPAGAPEGAELLDETAYAQPALFAFEVALAELWRSWGVEPKAVLGHSLGELAAACFAGVLSLEEGIALVAERGRLMQGLAPGGQMATLSADERRVAEALSPWAAEVAVAAVNGPAETVISGSGAAVQAVMQRLEAEGVKGRLLQVAHAFHSPLMDPMLDPLERAAARASYRAPRMELVTNVSGQAIEGFSAAHVRRHARAPVRFAEGMQALRARGVEVFIEIGPQPVLLAMGRLCVPETYGTWLPSLRKGREDWSSMLQSLSALYLRGADIDWAAFDREYTRRRVPLPLYPFQRQRHWLDRAEREGARELAGAAAFGARVPGMETASRAQQGGASVERDPLYELAWRLRVPAAPPPSPSQAGRWLIFADDHGLGDALAKLLAERREIPVLVRRTDLGRPADNGGAVIDPNRLEDFLQLFTASNGSPGVGGPAPWRGVVHLWSLDAAPPIPAADLSVHVARDSASAGPSRTEQLGVGSALLLVQALARVGVELRMWLVTRGVQAVKALEKPSVEQAPLVGLGRVIALEHPMLWGGLIDLDPSAPAPAVEVRHLLDALLWQDGEDCVALRGADRWVPRLVASQRATPARDPEGWRPRVDGTYLITGGLGALGLHVAAWMVAQGARHLVLAGRSGASDAAMTSVHELRAKGAQVEITRMDVARADEVTRGIEALGASMPPLRGVIHAAGVLDDGVLVRQDPARFRAVLAPKVEGAWNLHVATRALPIEVFVLFSSGASLLGSPGQGSYAAANAFLDALAHLRRAEGLPALSIHWGPWAEGGMAAALGSREQQRWASRGVASIPPAEGLALMAQLLGGGFPAEVGVLPIDWAKFAGALQPPSPLLAELLLAAQPAPGPQGNGLLRRIEALRPEERLDSLVTFLWGQVAGLLGLDPASPPAPQQGLFALGLDSLMALDLQQRLQRETGRALPSTLLFNHPNLDALSRYLAEQLFPAPPPRPPPEETSLGPDADGSLEQLSAGELAALLDDEVAAILDERN